MQKLLYYYSKFFQKILRGKCVSNSLIHKSACVNSGCLIHNSSLGRYSYMGYDCEVINTDIGSFCSLSSGIHTGLAQHPIDWVSTSPVFQDVSNSSVKGRFAKLELPEPKRTTIGHDVWIGTNAIIKAGVNVGTGAVIASGAIVTKDVPPYAIVGGCPAKIIRFRFDDEMIKELLQSKWWELNESDLYKVGKFANKPMEFMKAIQAL